MYISNKFKCEMNASADNIPRFMVKGFHAFSKLLLFFDQFKFATKKFWS